MYIALKLQATGIIVSTEVCVAFVPPVVKFTYAGFATGVLNRP